MRPVRFTKSSRNHRIGRVHVLYVMATTEPQTRPAQGDRDPQLYWLGEDDRGVELEIIAADLPDCLLVFHAFPTALRSM